ncbi:MAG: hypothetical protein V4725_14940 [Bacteroidota bacterium]|nr:hypothetical protein [Ferruginibacter sp.]
MKKMIFCLAVLAAGFHTASAQDDERIFKRFKGDVSLGYAAPIGSESDGGFIFAMEPKFGITDQLSLGLRMEAAVTAKFKGNDIYGDPQVDNARGYGSYLATADYYFTKNYSFRPFIGGGAGVFGVVDDENTFTEDPVTAVKFGGILRTGLEARHFRLGVEYNFVPSTMATIYTYDNLGNVTETRMSIKNTYVGIKLGFVFGGGLR